MKIGEKEIRLKNGQTAILRSPTAEDALAQYDLRRATSEETYFMARYPEELEAREEILCRKLSETEADPVDLFLSVFAEGKMVADVGVYKLRGQLKFRHRAGLGISVRRDYWGRGLGSMLLAEAIRAARENGFEQLELGVFADNTRAIRLYEKAGFQKVGVQPRAFKLKDGTYRDEIMMVLFL